jgi:EAL domain-containing protein (putative c-di-GMP-specific phosphodiesterase class I)/CheY-like chemotaxis protein
MQIYEQTGSNNVVTFGRRKVRPRVCIADDKQHIRTFLSEALQELGFVTCECEHFVKLGEMIDAQMPDLVVLGLTTAGCEAAEMLQTLVAKPFTGKVLLLGPRASPAVTAIEDLAELLGLELLPTLYTPFGETGLHDSVAALLPAEDPPEPPIYLDEATREGWLELWYQPEINTRSLAIERAEALVRIRHPKWGVVPPAYFIPDNGDPNFRALSEYVIGRAVEDWRYFLSQKVNVQIAINLPIAFLRDSGSVDDLCRQMPVHPAFDGLIVEINGTEVIRNLDLAKDVARQLRFHNIAIAIDDLCAEWPQFAGLADFPFVEIKVDRKFVSGCADDRLKQSVCRRILALADGYGARTVAEGVETKADFLAIRDMGFDKVQGFYFAKPSMAKKFARNLLDGPVSLPN